MLGEIGTYVPDQSLLGVICAFFSAVIALCSMVVSVRYANLAKRAAKHAEVFYTDELVRSVFLAANNILAETMHADTLAMGALRDMHARTREDGTRVFRLDLCDVEAIRRDRDEIRAVQKHARDVLENQNWRKEGKEVLLDLITKLDANLVTVERLKERFGDGLERSQVRQQS